MKHDVIEKNAGLMGVLIVVAVSLGGLAEIIPLMLSRTASEPLEGMQPYTAIQLEGRDIYIREGCANCHSQMIRPFRAETERYGRYSLAAESVWDHPFLFGSKRTGPDLARVGGRYTDEWHRVHLTNPRDVVPESNMPSYPWLLKNEITASDTPIKLQRMLTLGVPYSEEDIAGAEESVAGKTEMEALIAYLQGLGVAARNQEP